MSCPRCGFVNADGMNFCGQCGAKLTRVCPSCGAANLPAHAFCGACGRAMGELEESAAPAETTLLAPPGADDMAVIRRYLPLQLSDKILASRGRIEGERKQVTVLFADMKGYTPLAEALGEEAVYHLMDRVYERMITAVHQEEGAVQELTGDGILALFGAPVALEAAPLRACRAALAIQARMRSLSGELEAKHGVRLQVRIGIHTGPVVVGTVGTDLRTEYKAVGDTVNLASRLESIAEPGHILISEAAHRLVENYVQSTFAGEREIKGKVAPQRVYGLEGLKPGVLRFDVSLQRGLTPLVGRRRELEILEQCCHETRRDVIHVVQVVGEAGIGKSRLMHELHQRLGGDRSVFLQGHCTAFGGSTSFLPFIEVVRSLFRLGEGVEQQEVTRKLRQGLEWLGMPIDTSLPFLLALLGLEVESDVLRGLDGEIIGARTREVLQGLLWARCRLSPLVLLIEDLHWSDSASEELLLRLVQSEERLPVMILCSYRPYYRSPWTGHQNVTELRLEPLSGESTIHVVRQRLGTETLPEELAQIIVEKAEGNPLFAEEITRYLLDRGDLRRMDGGMSFQLAGEKLHIPATLQDLLLARVDRLEEGARTTLQVASVIGRRFPLDLVHTVLGVNGHMAQYFRDLEAHELIFREDVEDREEYRFKHALIQDAIYETLLTPRREELHQRVAEAIEGQYPDRLGEWAEVLAHHWSHTRRIDKAVRYLALAGEKSLRVYALEEAHRRFRQVVELMETVPGCADDTFLADVLLSWVRVYYYRKDFKGLIALVERYLPRIEVLDDVRWSSLLLFWLGFSHAFGARYDVAKPLLEKALALGETLDDAECIGYACLGLMWLHTYWVRQGEHPHDIVDQLGDRGLDIADKLCDVYLASKCLLGLAIHRLLNGRFNEARGYCSRLLELGRKSRDPRTTAMGLWMVGQVFIFEEQYEEAIENAEEALRLSPDPLDRLTAYGVKGASLALMGRSQEGVEILREVRQEMVAGDFLFPLAGIDISYGAAMVLAGQMAAGVRWIEHTIRRFTMWGNETPSVFGYMILGEIYLQMALGKEKPPLRMILRNLGFVLRTLPIAAGKARRHLEEAVRRARDADMPGFLARSLLDLGLLCQAKKRQAEARAYLEKARQIAEPLESPQLSGKIQAALASLDTVTGST